MLSYLSNKLGILGAYKKCKLVLFISQVYWFNKNSFSFSNVRSAKSVPVRVRSCDIGSIRQQPNKKIANRVLAPSSGRLRRNGDSALETPSVENVCTRVARRLCCEKFCDRFSSRNKTSSEQNRTNDVFFVSTALLQINLLLTAI